MTRLVIGALGVAATAYGAVLLAGTGWDNVVAALVWLGAGVVAHDAVLAPLTLAAGLLVGRLVPGSWRAAVVGALVVVGTVTIVAIPVLGRFGARADNPSLLDRDYSAGWLLLTAVVVLGTLAGRWLRRRVWHPRDLGGRPDGTRAGR